MAGAPDLIEIAFYQMPRMHGSDLSSGSRAILAGPSRSGNPGPGLEPGAPLEGLTGSRPGTDARARDGLAEGVVVAGQNGDFRYFNPVAEKILGIGLQEILQRDWSSVYGCHHSDQVTPYDSDQLPLARAIRGEVITDEVMFIRNPERPEGIFITTSGKIPLVAGDTMVFLTDGILETLAEDDLDLEIERALDVVRRHQTDAPVAILEQLIQSVLTFRQNGPPEDNITSIIGRIKNDR